MSHPRARRFAATALLAGASALPLIGGTATVASAAGLPVLGSGPATALLGGSTLLNTPLAASDPNSTLATTADTPGAGSNGSLNSVNGALPTNALPVANTIAGGPTGIAPGLTNAGSSALGVLGGLS